MAKHKSQTSRPQEPRKRIRNLADYLSWSDACDRIYQRAKSFDVVHAELVPKLKSGQIKFFIRVIDRQTRNHRDHRPSRTLWREVEIAPSVGLPIRWSRWAEKRRRENALPAWYSPDDARRYSYYVFLKRDDVDRHWPVAATAAIEPVVTAAIAPAVEQNKRPPGKKPQLEWRTIAAAYLIRIADLDGIPDNVTEVSKKIWQIILDELGDAPSLSVIRDWVSQLLSRARAITNSS